MVKQPKRGPPKRKKGLSPHQAYKLAREKNLSIRQMYKLIIGSKVP